MALTNKQRKKLNRTLNGIDQRYNAVITDIIFQYFAVFCVSLLFDRIAASLFWQYQKGFGVGQIAVCVICIVQMGRYYKMIRR